MAFVSFKNVSKIYPPSVVAVNGFSLEVFDKEFLVLVGPSGCGKSTVLRLLAGLENPSSGRILIDNVDQARVAIKDRGIAMVFQNYTLFPHMTVEQNIAFGLRYNKSYASKINSESVKKIVQNAAQVLNLTDCLKRKPGALSGGEKQRTALARAMVNSPKVFLLDEPLSNLDATMRLKARNQIVKLQKSLQGTFIYVTHDQVEAMTMADRIVVMNKGIIQQIDTPARLYSNPKNIFVNSFIASTPTNFFDGFISFDGKNYVIDSLFCCFNLSQSIASKIPLSYLEKNQKKNIVLGVRPQEIYLAKASKINKKDIITIEAIVDFTEELGGEAVLHTLVNDTVPLTLKIPSSQGFKTGENVLIALNKDSLKLFDKETESNIAMQ